MNKVELERLLKPLVSIYDDIELDLIRNIIDRIDNYDGVKGSLEWYIDRLNDIFSLDKQSIKIFKDNKQKIKEVLENILNEAGYRIDNIDTLNDYYNRGIIKVNPLNIYDNIAINTLINEAFKDCKDIMDLIQTKAIEGTQRAYKDVINKAYVETAGGIYTYTEAIRRALDKYAENGIEAAHYESGRTLRIESVVRRDVKTRVSQLVADKVLETAKQLGTNLIYVTQHLGARIRTPYMKNDYEAHAEWQGKVYMIEGSSSKYYNLREKTGYKEMLGLCGLNCNHTLEVYFEGQPIPDEIDEVKNKEKYELDEKQRAYERKIRALKYHKEIAKRTGDKEEFKKWNKKYKLTNEKYNKFLEENNLRRDYSREYISKNQKLGLSANTINTLEEHKKPILLENIDITKKEIVDSTINKYENIIKDDKIENAIVITQEGKVYQCFGNENNVWPDVDLGEELTNAIVTHNHLKEKTFYSFSKSDVRLFEKYDLKILRGIDDKYIYELNSKGKPSMKELLLDEIVEDDGYEHRLVIEYSKEKNISYKRWKHE